MKYLTIGEVSKLLNVSESALRFWQEKGIFSVPQDQNHYRKYTVADLVQIAEVIFYRNIGVPVKEMAKFSSLNLEGYDHILENLEQELAEKIRSQQLMQRLIEQKREHIRTIQRLKRADYLYEEVPFTYLARFDYGDREKLIRYTQDPSFYVRCMDSHDLSQDVRGIIVEQPGEGELPLWEKRGGYRYASFLIEEIPSEDYRNNIPEKLACIQQKHETGVLLANFLMSETTGEKRIDYLKGYVTLL